VNVLAAIASLFPWGRQRFGFLTTHAALALILIGAVVSYFFKVEGQLGLWEGDRGDEIVEFDRVTGQVASRATLPFSIQLHDFRIDHYQGTMRPSNFRSDFQVVEPSGKSFPAAVWMNHPFEYQGWTFFQSSYRQDGGREATILSVSKDPGQPIVFVGYTLLVLGMCIVLATRISQAKQDAAHAAAAERTAKKGLGIVAGAAVLFAALPAQAADPVDAAARLPVQHDGRVMALDTLAREAVWHVTGKRSWKGEDAVAIVTSWTADPAAAAQSPVVLVGDDELAAAAGLPPGTTHASFGQLVSSGRVRQLMSEARRAAAAEQPRRGAVAAAEKLEERLVWMQRFLERDALRSMPPGGNLTGRWNPAPMADAASLAAFASGPRLEGWPQASDMDREVTYNRVRPTRIAWIVLAIALVASIFALNGKRKALDGVALAGLVVGFGVMTWGIWTRWLVGDRIPAANMYESLLFLAWGVGLFAVVAFAFIRNRIVVMNANAMAALTMALTDLLPIDSFIHPVPPVLAGTPWLAIHVPIIMVSYSVLALGVVIAHLQIGFTIFGRNREDTVNKMNDLLYWYIQIGSILLIAGILTGSIWAADSWGRYWGWDPKEVWSLVAFLAYMAIIHARWDKMIGRFAVAAWSIVAFQTILMTYLGVNYVLGTGLHSYGFGDSPVLTWMIVVCLAETAFLAAGVFAYRRLAAGGAGKQLKAA
jgi:cytochrome c-type biogenesis protein CcsB